MKSPKKITGNQYDSMHNDTEWRYVHSLLLQNSNFRMELLALCSFYIHCGKDMVFQKSTKRIGLYSLGYEISQE